jgi:hypothetical protein
MEEEPPQFDERAQQFMASVSNPQPQSIGPPLGVDEQIKKSDAQIRKVVSIWIMCLFGATNVFMLVLIVWLAEIDQAQLAAHLIAAPDRLVNNEVLIALLGATTVQLGTVTVIMAKYVFKAPG